MEVANLPLAFALIVILFGDAVACAIPIDPIRNDLNRLAVPEKLQRAIPLVKFAAVAGLVLGLWIPRFGVMACAGLFVYFTIALQFHWKAKDSIARYLPALAFMAFVVATLFLSYQ